MHSSKKQIRVGQNLVFFKSDGDAIKESRRVVDLKQALLIVGAALHVAGWALFYPWQN